MTADVLPFACQAMSPGGTATCDRRRGHDGIHRGYTEPSGDHAYAVPARLLEWPDVAAYTLPHPLAVSTPPPPPNPEDRIMPFGDRPEHRGPRPPQALDERTETWADAVPLPAELDGRFWQHLGKHVRGLAALLLIVATLCAPAVVIAVWRAAL